MSTPLTTLFGDHPDVLVLEFLAGHTGFDYNVSDIARFSGVSRPTAYKVVDRLRRRGLVTRTRKVGTSSFFALDEGHALVKPLLELDLRLGDVPKRKRLPRGVKT